MNVEIFSDVVCPWCYLATTRFGAAAEAFDGDVQVAWRAFQLDPDARGGGRTDDVLAERFGGADRVAAARDRLRGLMAAENLPYAPEQAIYANTRNAHRVIALAGDAQEAVVRRLFRAHHAEGRDLNDPATLAELAAEAGFGGAAERLAAGDGDTVVAEQVEQAGLMGITGVPFFVFEGKWAVSGAQSSEVFTGALREVAAQAEQA